MPFGRLHIGRYLNRRSRDVCIKSDVADKLFHRLGTKLHGRPHWGAIEKKMTDKLAKK